LLSGLIFTSCKNKEADSPTPQVIEPSPPNKQSDMHACVEKHLPEAQQRSEAAIYTSSQWQPGQTIRIKFLNGDVVLQERVKNTVKTWLSYANLKFAYVTATEQSDIRIAFKYQGDQGSWSYFGTDCQRIPDQNEATMNFGWFDANTSDAEIQRTALHEFGHALGLIHEQSSPAQNINWNKEVVYNYYTGAPNYWTRADVDNNVFFKFSASQTNYTAFDKLSIMMYAVPASFTTDGFSAGNNYALSETDKFFIGQRYPFASTVKSILYSGERMTSGQYLQSPDGNLKLALQNDGNLVLYKSSTIALWNSRTNGKPITQLVMEKNGNLVMYDNNNRNYWQTWTSMYPGGFLKVENTGSATLYQNGYKRWSTNTRI
ncbi:MAG: matrixin family metalloprotease, partial [Opitutaceae bacterium]|nr:matrixin family metalloprotease [Cytophagales bacterium]